MPSLLTLQAQLELHSDLNYGKWERLYVREVEYRENKNYAGGKVQNRCGLFMFPLWRCVSSLWGETELNQEAQKLANDLATLKGEMFTLQKAHKRDARALSRLKEYLS